MYIILVIHVLKKCDKSTALISIAVDMRVSPIASHCSRLSIVTSMQLLSLLNLLNCLGKTTDRNEFTRRNLSRYTLLNTVIILVSYC